MNVNAEQQGDGVLIVGAGPTGLALAIELGQRGVRCTVLERNARGGVAPRAKTTNVRTREHLRRWGIAGQLRARSPLGIDHPSNVVFVTRLAGHELARFENALYCAPGKNPLYSEHAQWIPQYTVEDVMREHAQTLPSVRFRFQCEVLDFVQDTQQVKVRVRDLQRGSEDTLTGAYLVGADGARSSVREAIGAKMTGTYGLSRNYNVVFKAPGLAQAHRHGPAIMYWQVNADSPSIMGPMDRGDQWFFMPTAVAAGVKFQAAEMPDLIRRATGIALPYEVLSSDEWVASSLLADRYRQGRVFLAGDACHLHPPMGGYGMNMGVADGVDLGWKLAAVLQGWGGATLLDSYERERGPVHRFVIEEATVNHAVAGHQLLQPGLEEDSPAGAQLRGEVGAKVLATKLREFMTLGVVLGYRYDESPVIVPDGSAPVPNDFINYVPTSRPGHLAPHAWLHDGSSLYDHFGTGFTLLDNGRGAAEDAQAVLHDAQACGLPLKALRPREPSLPGLYPQRFTLIRPDQHVAWRGDTWPAGGQALLRRVAGQSAAP